MPVWQWVLLLIVGIPIAGWLFIDALRDFGRIVAPDAHDSASIDRKFGADSPEADKVRQRRFGPKKPWYDALSALAGLVGLAVTYWILFS